ncbi:PAS fold-containing protein [Salinihabitans flavidus]|uniref:histidine kinase n=1 Tax=Salinihabitans flavidus TaxID=569882 RepID=A0A1H8VTV3_9RHOB|nr:PAS domain-containing sensor histidine kinase [Salinihabitans flavidus]SEP18785.1 PAS fold-containing protein [Salinihabitans flavidus]
MTEMPMFAALALAALLFALAVSLIVLQRLHRAVRRMLDAAPREEGGEGARMSGVLHDLRRLEERFDEMNAQLEAQAATLEQACELANLGTWTLLPDLKSVRTMPHMRAILGFPEEEDIVRIDALRERIVAEDCAAFDAALERAMQERRTTDVEFRALDAVGNVRVFRALTGPSGALPDETHGGISGIIQDITDLRRNEAALARSLRLERQAGEVARIGGWHYEVATRRLSGTQEKANLVGADGGEPLTIEGQIARFEDENDRKRIEQGFWTCVGAGTRFDEIARFRRLDGKETWLRVIGEAERDQSGEIVGVYGALQDVGESVGAQRAKDEAQALLQTILDSLGDGFVIHARDGTIQYMNRKAHGILGVPDLDLVGGNIWQDLHKAVGTQFGQLISDALETGEIQTFEGEIDTPDQWIKVKIHPTPAGVAIYFNDVTGERETRVRLRLLDAAMSRLKDVVMITDAKTLDLPGPRVVFVNEAFTTTTGYSQDEILGATPRMLQGPDTERERLDEIRTALQARQSIRTELTNYRKDGSSFTTEIDVNPLFDAAGECTHFVSVQRDTTERREDEERLLAREEQFRLASLASQDIIWDWDMLTGIIWNSDNSEAIFGTVSEWHVENNPEGRIENILERIHPDDRLKIIESLDAALTGDAQTWHCEYRVRAHDGTWRIMTDKAFILREDDGAPRRMVGAMSDVTDLRLLDAQLHQSKKLETVGQLTGGIAHDFNNLLTIILGNCDILLDDIDDESAFRPLLQSIEDAAERGARISSDLLAFSRRQPLELRATDINALIRRSHRLFDRAVDASVEIRYDLTDSPTVAYVDPDKLEAALLNLVLNASAAIEQEGSITVRTRSTSIHDDDTNFECGPGEFVEVDVIDDGSGMPPEVAERAFEPFFTTKDPGVGTGMGLSSVYGMVKQSGGHASIDSEPGKGTTIVLCLPIAHEAELALPTESPKVTDLRGEHRILVAEDDADLRSFVSTVLGRRGYRVVEIENGKSALELLEKDDDFDLLLTDIVMPGGVNGVQLAKKAQKMHPDLKILFTSGYSRGSLPKERQVPSDIPMLYKPFRTNELVERVKDALAGRVASIS